MQFESVCLIINAVLNMISQIILIVIFNHYSGYDKETVVSEDHEGNIKIRTSQVSSNLDLVLDDYNESDLNTTDDKLKPTFRSLKLELLLHTTSEMFPSQDTDSKDENNKSRIS